MNNKVDQKSSSSKFDYIILIKFVFLFLFIFSTASFAESAKHWIALAENACISEENYQVNRKTDVYKETFDRSKNVMVKKLIRKGGARLEYTKKAGLKPIAPIKAKNETAAPTKPSIFTVDVGHMLKKMKGKVSWVLENEDGLLDKQACAVLSSSGEKWLVRLWIRKKDGVVLRYDQYLNNKFVGTTTIEYRKPRKGKHFPVKTSTKFHLTNHIVSQQYYEYFFSETEE